MRSFVHAQAPKVLVSVQRRVGGDAVALTFDDGPHPVYTPLVLEALERLGVQATFFCLGRAAERHPTLVRAMVDAGHAVGSHSYSHPNPWSSDGKQLVADYRAGRDAVEHAAGRAVRLFRPPKGHVALWEAVAIRRLGLAPWLWTCDPRDWDPAVDADALVANVRSIGGGDVVLLHDAIEDPLAPRCADRSATVALLRPLVGVARDRGLPLVTLAEPT